MKRIAIFASGNGSNAERIALHFADSHIARVTHIITNRKEAYVKERAKKLEIPCEYFPKKAWETGEEVLEFLKTNKTDYIVLAGFLLKVPELLVKAFPRRILNIHPALLPKHGGKGMYGMNVHQAVVEAHEKESGITIHLIDEEYDRGEILFQASCTVLPEDRPEDVAEKVHALEYKYFPVVIKNHILADLEKEE